MLALAFSGIGLLSMRRRNRRTLVVAKRLDGATELKSASRVVPLTQEATAPAEPLNL